RGPARTRAGRGVLEVGGVIGVLVLAFAWTHVSGQSNNLYRGGLFVCALAGVAIIAAASPPQPGPIAKGFSLPPLAALGIISYGVYLWHWPVYVLLDEPRTGFGGWPLTVLRIAVTLGIAILSYYAIEQPIRRGALNAAQLRALVPAVATAVVVALVAS